MLLPLELPQYVKDLLNLWKEDRLPKDKMTEAQKYIEQSDFLTSLAIVNENFISFTSHYDNTVLSYSNNLKSFTDLEVSFDNRIQNGIGLFLSLIPQKQCEYLVARKLFETSLRVHLNKNFDDVNFVCGYIFQTKDGSRRILSNLSIPIDFINFRPVIVMHIFTDITHLVKNKDKWWARFEAKTFKLKTVYKSEKTKFYKSDILTAREFEVIKLFDQGLDMGSISEKLNISYNTTDNHRKNIILKTNTINITAAIQILKIGNIL